MLNRFIQYIYNIYSNILTIVSKLEIFKRLEDKNYKISKSNIKKNIKVYLNTYR